MYLIENPGCTLLSNIKVWRYMQDAVTLQKKYPSVLSQYPSKTIIYLFIIFCSDKLISYLAIVFPCVQIICINLFPSMYQRSCNNYITINYIFCRYKFYQKWPTSVTTKSTIVPKNSMLQISHLKGK